MSIDTVLNRPPRVQDLVEVPRSKRAFEVLPEDWIKMESMVPYSLEHNLSISGLILLTDISILDPRSPLISKHRETFLEFKKKQTSSLIGSVLYELEARKTLGIDIGDEELKTAEEKFKNCLEVQTNPFVIANFAKQLAIARGRPTIVSDSLISRVNSEGAIRTDIQDFMRALSDLVISGNKLPPGIPTEEQLDLLDQEILRRRATPSYSTISSLLVAKKILTAEKVYFKDGRLQVESTTTPQVEANPPLPETRRFGK